MTDNQKLGFVFVGTLTAIGLLVTNFLVLSRLGNVEQKIEKTDESIKEIKQEVEVIKESLYDSGIKLTLSNEEKKCLAKNIFFEAGIEPIEGKIAVAQVTMNRLETKRWGDNVCSVIYARKQFSWTLEKKKVNEKPSGPLWKESMIALEKFIQGYRIVGLENSRHYHADYIKKPYWAKKKRTIETIGQHIFYEK